MVENTKETKKENPKKAENKKGNASKIQELKVELLKNPTKRKRIKREIARLLTMDNAQIKSGDKS